MATKNHAVSQAYQPNQGKRVIKRNETHHAGSISSNPFDMAGSFMEAGSPDMIRHKGEAMEKKNPSQSTLL